MWWDIFSVLAGMSAAKELTDTGSRRIKRGSYPNNESIAADFEWIKKIRKMIRMAGDSNGYPLEELFSKYHLQSDLEWIYGKDYMKLFEAESSGTTYLDHPLGGKYLHEYHIGLRENMATFQWPGNVVKHLIASQYGKYGEIIIGSISYEFQHFKFNGQYQVPYWVILDKGEDNFNLLKRIFVRTLKCIQRNIRQTNPYISFYLRQDYYEDLDQYRARRTVDWGSVVYVFEPTHEKGICNKVFLDDLIDTY